MFRGRRRGSGPREPTTNTSSTTRASLGTPSLVVRSHAGYATSCAKTGFQHYKLCISCGAWYPVVLWLKSKRLVKTPHRDILPRPRCRLAANDEMCDRCPLFISALPGDVARFTHAYSRYPLRGNHQCV